MPFIKDNYFYCDCIPCRPVKLCRVDPDKDYKGVYVKCRRCGREIEIKPTPKTE